jgi:adenylosuccinate lyase
MIHPIEYRYGTPEMKAIWEEEAKLRRILMVESALATAEADFGLIPTESARIINERAKDVELERVKEIEAEINHDVMAVVLALSERCKEDGRWVHLGATSNDVTDTALALQLKDSIGILKEGLRRLRDVLVGRAEEHTHTVCAGRTHGQIGIPTTYGLRFAIWAEELDRHIVRLEELKPRMLVGKMSGAVGTGASFGEYGIKIEEKMMKYLGLNPANVSNQVLQRDRHAEFVMLCANVATTLEKICTEIRILQRSEIKEVEEFFSKKQVGSSTMPHKRNPIKSEQVCGLARMIRSSVEPALLNNTLWDERDLTNSSAERIIFPEVCILTDHVIRLTTDIIKNMRFHPENIRRNLFSQRGSNMAEAVMIRLVDHIGRQTAHERVRRCAMKAQEEDRDLKDLLLEDEEIIRYIGEEIDEIMNPYNYIGVAVEKVERVVRRLRGG